MDSFAAPLVSFREMLTLLALGGLWDDKLCRLQVGGWMHQHKLLQVEILLLKLLQLLKILKAQKQKID